MSKGVVGGVIAGIAIVAAVVFCVMCLSVVPAGYVAVQYNMNGGIQDEVLGQGWHMVPPNISTSLYTVGLEQSYLTAGKNGDSEKNESFSASTSEGKDIQVDLTFTYQFQSDRIKDVFTYFKGQSGTTVRDIFIKPNIISWTKEVIAQYKVADIIGSQRASINKALTEYLSGKFDQYGITITNVSLINIEVDEKTAEAINAKISAQQNAETQAIMNQTNIDKAEAEATVKKTQAQAEADALLISANAQADANKMLESSISSGVLSLNWISKWDGKLPTVMSDGSGMMLDIGSIE